MMFQTIQDDSNYMINRHFSIAKEGALDILKSEQYCSDALNRHPLPLIPYKNTQSNLESNSFD